MPDALMLWSLAVLVIGRLMYAMMSMSTAYFGDVERSLLFVFARDTHEATPVRPGAR